MPYNIGIDAALPRNKAMTKEQVFDSLAGLAADRTSYPKQKIIDRLIEKEQVSLSGVGGGVAIPHLKIKGLESRFVALTTLNNPIDFKALDEKPADLVCMLLSPESDGGLHLRGLSRISRLFRNEEFCEKLREAKDEATLMSLFMNPDGWLLAA